jgi:hypothetical protein
MNNSESSKRLSDFIEKNYKVNYDLNRLIWKEKIKQKNFYKMETNKD